MYVLVCTGYVLQCGSVTPVLIGQRYLSPVTGGLSPAPYDIPTPTLPVGKQTPHIILAILQQVR